MVSDSFAFNANSKNGIASSQSISLGAGAGYADISIGIVKGQDWFFDAKGTQVEWQVPVINKDFLDSVKEELINPIINNINIP